MNSLSFHPSGNYCVSGSSDAKIKIMDLLQARTIYTLSGHQSQVTSVSFSPGGEHCVTGGQDNHILVWKLNLDVGDEGGKEKVVQEVTNDKSGEREQRSERTSSSMLNLAGSTKYPEESKQSSRVPMRNLDDDLRQLDIEDKENKREEDNKETLQQLRTINKNLDTLTKTVLLMERRLSLVEDQIKLMSQKNDN